MPSIRWWKSYRMNKAAQLTDTEEQCIELFLDAMWVERGLSNLTLAAYRTDLMGYARWLADNDSSLLDAGRDRVLGYLASRAQAGIRSRSTARLLSALRRFYRYQVREGRLDQDPTALVESPKPGKPLPAAL